MTPNFQELLPLHLVDQKLRESKSDPKCTPRTRGHVNNIFPRMATYERITELGNEIQEACEGNVNFSSDKFLPHDKLAYFVEPRKVKSALQAANVSDPEHLAEFILKDAKLLFLILVLMTRKTEERLSLLRDLQRDQVNDLSLPIGFRRDQGNHYYGYPMEGPEGGPKFTLFNNWEHLDRDAFENYQWRLIAPVFGGDRFRFRFASRRVLPYLQVASKPASSGFFGEVSQVEIHAAHIILPESQVVSKPLLFS